MNSYEQPKQPAPKQAIHRSATVTLFVKQKHTSMVIIR